jgi:hypothetical protein
MLFTTGNEAEVSQPQPSKQGLRRHLGDRWTSLVHRWLSHPCDRIEARMAFSGTPTRWQKQAALQTAAPWARKHPGAMDSLDAAMGAQSTQEALLLCLGLDIALDLPMGNGYYTALPNGLLPFVRDCPLRRALHAPSVMLPSLNRGRPLR